MPPDIRLSDFGIVTASEAGLITPRTTPAQAVAAATSNYARSTLMTGRQVSDRGGWAGGKWPQQQMLSHVPRDRGQASAIADCWTPPHPMSLPADLCDELVADATRTDPAPNMPANGEYRLPASARSGPILDELVKRMKRANKLWWRLELTGWGSGVKRYGTGVQHPEHMDWYPASADEPRKLSASVQLSDPDDYRGGSLFIRWMDHRLVVPRERGTFVVWPSWINHGVEPITSGERWSLVIHGTGPPLR